MSGSFLSKSLKRTDYLMQADDDLKTTLTKWPFVIGDILLVATALAIAFSANWQMSDWQVAYCVVAVALGALLFVLPYIVEFRVRVIEEQQDRGADIRVLKRDLDGALRAVDFLGERLRAVESSVAHTPDPEPASSGDVLEGKIDEYTRRLSRIERDLEKTKEKIQVQPLGNDEVAAEESLVAETTGGDVAEPEPVEPAVEKVSKALIPEKPIRSKAPVVQRQKREPRLLKRAIKDKQDGAATAVTRIIEARVKKQAERETAVASPAPEDLVEPDKMQDESIAVEADKEEKTEEGNSLVPGAVLTPEGPTEARSSESVEDGLLFEEDSSLRPPKKKKRPRKRDALVTASVFIGIGNKPYLRGSGAGLNWETGIPMDFEEIGKWSWLAPEDFVEPVEIQIYRNDEDPDTLGRYTLDPEQKLDLRPVFD